MNHQTPACDASQAAPTGVTITARLNYKSGRKVKHVVEVIDYHVRGYKRCRCLTHGEDLGPMMIKSGADAKTIALIAARRCAYVRSLPFAPRRAPLAPSLPPKETS